MKLSDPRWRESDAQLQAPLREYLKSCDMGASRYEAFDKSRAVSIKHRLRKDKQAVVSLGCWEQGPWDEEKDFHSYVRNKFFVTTAMPSVKTCKELSAAFLAFLETGDLSTLNFELSTYPGYEAFDQDTRDRVL